MQEQQQNVNIRATALEAFWGDYYSKAIYLWHGSARKYSLNKINNSLTPILDDMLSDKSVIIEASDNCKALHEKILIHLTEKLNTIHNVKLSSSFYRTAFGYWLYRHICITYDKFIVLRSLDESKISIKLLAQDSFFIPFNHYDYFSCFTSDFGVQQLVSIYLYMREHGQFCQIHENFALNNETGFNTTSIKPSKNLITKRIKNVIKKIFFKKVINDTEVALIETYFTDKNKLELFSRSDGKIRVIGLPQLNCMIKPVDFLSRNKLSENNEATDFEQYFYNTLSYCFPKLYLEYFKEYFFLCKKDIKSKNFKFIVSEGWISNIPSSIYLATAQLLGKKFICYEHAANTILYDSNMFWIQSSASDIFLTVGWHMQYLNTQRGGFAICDKVPYKFEEYKKDILFINFVRPPFLIELCGNNRANFAYIKQLEYVNDFLNELPIRFKEVFIFRPRYADYFWDTEKALELNERNVRVDKNVFSESIQKARIIIINHMSSGLAEIILNDIPFILFLNPDTELLSSKYPEVFEKLFKSKILHYTKESVFDHLTSTYEDVKLWWESSQVRDAIEYFKSEVLSDSTKTVEYLLSLISKS